MYMTEGFWATLPSMPVPGPLPVPEKNEGKGKGKGKGMGKGFKKKTYYPWKE